MRKQAYDYDPRETDALLRQADAALEEEPDPNWEDSFASFDDTMVYQNYSNRYGRDVRNYQNNYGQNEPREEFRPPQPQAAPFRAYNADFAADGDRRPVRKHPGNTMADAAAHQARGKAPGKPMRPAPRKRRIGCLIPILLVIALLVAAWFLLIRPPKTDQPIGTRKSDTATILLCGTDVDAPGRIP